MPNGSLVHAQALDCGHWVRCYSLDPTPLLCKRCASVNRNRMKSLLEHWLADVRKAVDAAEDVRCEDIPCLLKEDGIRPDADFVKKLESVADHCDSASWDLRQARELLTEMLENLPPEDGDG